MKKKTTIFAFLLLAVVLTGVGVMGTYARYQTSQSGTGTANVAKWDVALKQGTNALTSNFTLALTYDTNEFVADNVIAPGRGASGALNVELGGTQVSTDIIVDVNNIELGGSALTNEKITVEVTGTYGEAGTGTTLTLTKNASGAYEGMIPYTDIASGKNMVNLKVNVKWVNDEGNNATDTTTGTYGSGVTSKALTANVTLTARQHIASN